MAMTVFKSLDIRGLSFFSAFDMTAKAFNEVKSNGILEIIQDKQKNFTHAYREWADKRGYKVSNIDEDGGLVRLFIKKASNLKSKRK